MDFPWTHLKSPQTCLPLPDFLGLPLLITWPWSPSHNPYVPPDWAASALTPCSCYLAIIGSLCDLWTLDEGSCTFRKKQLLQGWKYVHWIMKQRSAVSKSSNNKIVLKGFLEPQRRKRWTHMMHVSLWSVSGNHFFCFSHTLSPLKRDKYVSTCRKWKAIWEQHLLFLSDKHTTIFLSCRN